MKQILLSLAAIAALISASALAQTDPAAEPNPGAMSDAYYRIWNEDVQKAIDDRIEKFRKADAVVELTDVQPGSEIKVEQISHEFVFGAHIFNFNQLGTTQRNEKYKALYGAVVQFRDDCVLLAAV